MLKLKAKLLSVRELPERPPYPPSILVSLLEGPETLHLIARPELREDIESIPELGEAEFELRYRRIEPGRV